MNEFIRELQELLTKHNVVLTGQVRQPSVRHISGAIAISDRAFQGMRYFDRISATEAAETK